MIRGLHGLVYSSDPDATRAFMRDALRLPFSDVGGGWLIFDLPEGDLGVHPIEPSGPPANTHALSFYCDDIQATVAELASRGVTFAAEPADHGYGWVTHFTMPGGVEVQLYEPTYQKAAKVPPRRPTTAATGTRPAAKAKPTAKAKRRGASKARKVPARASAATKRSPKKR